MKKIVISVSVFLIMISGMVYSISYLSKVTKNLVSLGDTLEKQVEKEQWKEAYKSSMELTEKWKKYCTILSIYVHHAEVDNIDNELWKLSQYTKTENKDESLASIHVVKFFFNHISSMEKINIQNLF